MDAFLEPFWNLDQIRGWAETRDPEIIRAAACPRYGEPKRTLEIAIRTTHMATAILRGGRDIDGELWAASGSAPRSNHLIRPRWFRIMPKSMDGPLISPTDARTSRCNGRSIPKRLPWRGPGGSLRSKIGHWPSRSLSIITKIYAAPWATSD